MPIGAVLLVRTQSSLSESELHRLRELFMTENRLGEDDFYSGGPLVVIRNPAEGPMPLRDEKSLWLDANDLQGVFRAGVREGRRKAHHWVRSVAGEQYHGRGGLVWP